MKVTCDFCKTEYSLGNNVAGAVKCAVCGHIWTVRRSSQKNVWLTFIAALCALLSAIVFAVVVIAHHQKNQTVNQPLVPTITDFHNTTDEGGETRFVVNGTVLNQSADIYGVPDLIVVMYDDDGRVIGRQKFMSPATLLDAGASVSFSYTLSGNTAGVRNVSVMFQPQGDDL